VHASKGRLQPASEHLLSEVAIVCRLARELLGTTVEADWQAFEDDYATVRERIGRVVPGFEDYEAKIAQPGGFVLPHAAAQRRWNTRSGRATFTRNELEYPHVPEGRLLMQTLRSHDQFNTTVYGHDDRYRGITDGRRVVFVHPADIAAQGLVDGQHVDLVSEYTDGERVAENFRVVAYSTARGCVASYYPETNVLVPLGHKADISGTPASKSVVVRLVPRADAPVPVTVRAAQPAVGR
jgi:anaerobic selenocysteine-containing dehydrogenase